MLRNHQDHFGPPAPPAGPFFLLLFIACSFAAGQQGNAPTVRLTAGTSYGDIFRQTSDRSRTTVFTRHSHIVLSGVRGDDSLTLLYSSEDRYAAVDQQQSKFTGSLLLGRRSITAGYSGMYSILRYGVSAGIPVDAARRTLQYGVSLSTAPFGPLVSASVSYSTAPERYSAGIMFMDFLVPTSDAVQGGSAAYSVAFAPLPSLTADVVYEESSGERGADNSGYSSRTRYHSIVKRLTGTYVFSEGLEVQAGASTAEYRMDLGVHKEGLSFGGLTNGAVRYVRYAAGTYLTLLKFSTEYSYEQFDLSGIGGIESWPFTTLAASIIANRLNYKFSGMLKHHTLTHSIASTIYDLPVTGILSYHRILTDAALEHWEPEFLVFGRKNFASEPFSIRDLHLLGLSITVQMPVMTADLMFSARQYLPLSVSYRSGAAAPAPGPAPAPAAPSSVTTDGGRHAAITLTVPL